MTYIRNYPPYLRLCFFIGIMNDGSGELPSSAQHPMAGGAQHVEPGEQQTPPSQHNAAPEQQLQRNSNDDLYCYTCSLVIGILQHWIDNYNTASGA